LRTLVATAMLNSKGKPIYCAAKKITEQHMSYIRAVDRQDLEAVGFTFIKLMSLEYPNVRGFAVFFEGHVNDIMPALRSIGQK